VSRDQNGIRRYITFITQIAPRAAQDLASELFLVQNSELARTVFQILLKHQKQLILAKLTEGLSDERFELVCCESLNLVDVGTKEDRIWWSDVDSCLSKERQNVLRQRAKDMDKKRVVTYLSELSTQTK
jgi:hypothetical protein